MPEDELTTDEIWSQVVRATYADNAELAEHLGRRFLESGEKALEIIRKKLVGRERDTAIFVILRCMKGPDYERLFDVLVRFASWDHGTVGEFRKLILSMPRAWVLERIERVAEPLLADTAAELDTYNNLLYLYEQLDPAHALQLAERALAHSDFDIQGVGEAFFARR